jgi:hypothetical protein
VAVDPDICPEYALFWNMDSDFLCLEQQEEAPSAQPQSLEICATEQGRAQECETGTSWNYVSGFCVTAQGAKTYELQRRISGDWVNVEGLQNRSNAEECPDSTNTWDFFAVIPITTPGEYEYRMLDRMSGTTKSISLVVTAT